MSWFDKFLGSREEPKADFEPELTTIDWNVGQVVFLPSRQGDDTYTVLELSRVENGKIYYLDTDDGPAREVEVLVDPELTMANLPTDISDIWPALSWSDLRRRVTLLKDGGIAAEDGSFVPREILLDMVRMGESGEIEAGNEECERKVTSTGGLRGVIVDLIKHGGHRSDLQLLYG